jgi:ParB family chromosome partitioning protein
MISETERWNPEDIARAGAVIGIGHGGRLSVERGLVFAEDETAPTTGGKAATGKTGRKMNGSPALSDKLVEDLTAHRTAALRVVLAENADVALVAVGHALALPLFYDPYEDGTCLALRLDSIELRGSAEGIEEGLAAIKLAARHELWTRHLPATASGLWDWLLSQDTAFRLDLLAVCAGCSVNAVRKRHEREHTERLPHADRLASALSLDMAAWWQPTATSYLARVPKALALEAVREGVAPDAAESSSAPPGSRHKPPDRDERRVNDERPQDGGVGWRNHAADARGQPPAHQPGCERKGGMTW